MNNEKMMMVRKSIQDSIKLLRALENLGDATQMVEEKFTDELHLFFGFLERKMLQEIDLDNPLDAIFYQHVTDTVNNYWSDYEEILSTYVDKAAEIGKVHSEILLTASFDHAKQYSSIKSQDKEQFFKPNAKVSSRLKKYKFEASESTKNRVTDEINKTLGEAYREGWGRENVTKRIQEKFTALKTYEARRIAVTEVNSARNIAHHNQLKADNIKYKKWIPSKDEKVRDSHKLHPTGVGGEIVPIDERFSNGLLHPGDKDGGPIKEWVNCRCTEVAFIIPYGYEAPEFWPFFEDDLIKTENNLLNTNILTDTQKEYYNSLQNELADTKVRFEEAKEKWMQHLQEVGLSKEEAIEIVDEGIASLEQGESIYPPHNVDSLFEKIRKTKEKIKQVEDVIKYLNKNKINISDEIQKINELSNHINLEDLKEILPKEQFYDIADIKNILKSNAKKLNFEYGMITPEDIEEILKQAKKTEKSILKLDELLEKAQKLMKNKPQTVVSTPTLKKDVKDTIVNTFRTDDMDFQSGGYKGLQKFAKKHKNKKTEYGVIMDIKTGEIYSPVFHGKKGSVHVPEKEILNSGLTKKEIKKIKKEDPFGWLTGKYKKQLGKQIERDYVGSDYCAVVHNHPQDGYHIFSASDLEVTFNSKKVKYCVAISEQETWILKTTNQNVSKQVTDAVVKEWDKIAKKIKKQQAEEIEALLDDINKIKDRKQRINKLKMLNKYLDSPEYMKKINDEMNDALVKFSKNHENVFTLKKVKTDDMSKIIKELDKPVKQPKVKQADPISNMKPFKKSNYQKDNERTRALERNQDVLQHQVRYKEAERESMNYWGHSGYEPINGKINNTDSYRDLLDRTFDPEAFEKELDKHIKNIDRVIEQSPGLAQDTILYRQGHWDVGLKAGDIGSFHGYSSTSYKPSVTNTFYKPSRYKITIYADEGTKGVRLNDQFGSITSEREWLLPRDQKFEVISVDDKKQEAVIRLIN